MTTRLGWYSLLIFIAGLIAGPAAARVTTVPIPIESVRGLAATPGGVVWLTGSGMAGRMLQDGTIQNDGSVAISAGRLLENGTFVPQPDRGTWDSTVGPDGRLWLAGPASALSVIDASGKYEEWPLAFSEHATVIASTHDEILFALPSAIGRIGAHQEPPDIAFREGDILSVQYDPWGEQRFLVHYRRGNDPFVRTIFPDRPYQAAAPVFALTPPQTGMSGGTAAAVMPAPFSLRFYDASGAQTRELVLDKDPLNHLYYAFDRAGSVHGIRMGWQTGRRFFTVDSRGVMRRDTPFNDQGYPALADLAADQCTLFYVLLRSGGTRIGRTNVCTSTVLPLFPGNIPPSTLPWAGLQDLRLTRNGDVILAYRAYIVRYDQLGNERQVLKAQPGEEFYSIALDPDPGAIWIGTNDSLRRVEWETGATTESLPIKLLPLSISIFGEPRAALVAPRRRAAGH